MVASAKDPANAVGMEDIIREHCLHIHYLAETKRKTLSIQSLVTGMELIIDERYNIVRCTKEEPRPGGGLFYCTHEGTFAKKKHYGWGPTLEEAVREWKKRFDAGEYKPGYGESLERRQEIWASARKRNGTKSMELGEKLIAQGVPVYKRYRLADYQE